MVRPPLKTLAANVVCDGISAVLPEAALSVPPLKLT